MLLFVIQLWKFTMAEVTKENQNISEDDTIDENAVPDEIIKSARKIRLE